MCFDPTEILEIKSTMEMEDIVDMDGLFTLQRSQFGLEIESPILFELRQAQRELSGFAAGNAEFHHEFYVHDNHCGPCACGFQALQLGPLLMECEAFDLQIAMLW